MGLKFNNILNRQWYSGDTFVTNENWTDIVVAVLE